MDAAQIAIVFAAVAVGFFAKGVTGIGGPLVAIPVLAAFHGVEFAVAVIAIPTLVANIWLLWTSRGGTSTVGRYLVPFLIAGGIGILFGVWVLVSVNDRVISLLLAVTVIGYIAWFLTNPQFKLPEATAKRLTGPVGLVAGGVHGATGISSPVVATFFHSMGLDRPAFIIAVTIPFLVLGMVQIATLAVVGAYDAERIVAGAVACIPALAMLPVGVRLGRNVSQQTFQYLVLAVLGVAALRLLWLVFA